MSKTMTVYEAVKDGLEKNPEIELGSGSPYQEGFEDEKAQCCAIGFAALSQCTLEEWKAVAVEHSDGYTSGALYHVLEDSGEQAEVYSWNDRYMRSYLARTGHGPTREQYLTALKKHKVGSTTLEFRSCEEGWD